MRKLSVALILLLSACGDGVPDDVLAACAAVQLWPIKPSVELAQEAAEAASRAAKSDDQYKELERLTETLSRSPSLRTSAEADAECHKFGLGSEDAYDATHN